MGKKLRGGYTTGACMAAGVKAALLYERGEECEFLALKALDDTILKIPVKDVQPIGDGIRVEIVKDAGDDPDITNGVSVFTTVRRLPKGSGLVFRAGEGIGTVTKAGLSVPVGEPAINPGPRELVRTVAEDLLGSDIDLEVTVSIPEGTELCKKTLNPILGVVGGISVIGTTGVLRPMSEEGFKNSLVPQIDVALAAGYDTQIFVPGKIGETLAVNHGMPQEAVVQMSNFIGFMLEAAAERGLKRVLLFGHIGKLVKVAAGVFYTHNRIADGRLETIGAYAAAEGMPPEGVKKVLGATTTEDALSVVEEYQLMHIFDMIAERASARAERFIFNKLTIGTVLATMQGVIVGMDSHAKEMGRDFHWDIKS